MRTQQLMILAATLPFLAAAPAHAYIGPGLGAGTVAVVLGVIGSILLAFASLIWYPAKRLLRRFRASQAAGNGDAGET
ncbi:MAG: hypothetical protein GVY09_16000 [Gammaproteobacteria bacterium]|jgi:hypothetical protein|nr:hypothetical protein [Gammaproteobacteria bacterium]